MVTKATLLGRSTSVYWASAAAWDSSKLLSATRDVSLDMGSETADDTVHGDTFKTFAPTYSTGTVKITGLYNTGAAESPRIIHDAINKVSGTFMIYIGNSVNYVSGSGYVSVDNVGAPYTDFNPFNWSILPSAALGFSP